MKTKDKKIRAIEFINKYQLGGNFNNYEIQNPYQYDPNLAIAQQNQILTPPLNQLNSAKNQSAYQSNQSSFLDSAVPFISPAINLGVGIANIFSSIKEKSRQKAYERAFRKDLERRQQESHFGDFYATPYSVGSGSIRSGAPGYQIGGEVNQTNQTNQTNQMDLFLDLYNQQESNRQLLDKQFQDYYQQKNNQMKQSWKSKQSAGLNSLVQGAISLAPMLQKGGSVDTIESIRADLKRKEMDIDMEKAKTLVKMAGNDPDQLKDYQRMVRGVRNADEIKLGRRKLGFGDRFREHQDGGEILNPVIDPTQDLYSPEYKVPPEVEDEVSQVQIEAKEDDTMMNWLFEDLPEEPEEPDEINQTYFQNKQPTEVIDQIGQQESGGNYEAINPTSGATGKYQFLPSAWASQIKFFMGLPDSFTREQVMQAFRKSPHAQEQFMQYVTENIYKPEVEKLRPLASKYGLDDNKLIRMLHYRGLSDTRKRLQTGDFEVSQEEKAKFRNPDILSYLNK